MMKNSGMSRKNRVIIATGVLLIGVTFIFLLISSCYDFQQQYSTTFQPFNKTSLNLLDTLTKNLSLTILRRMEDGVACADRQTTWMNAILKENASLVTVDISGGRLGNLMFQTASLIGIARRNNRLPYFRRKDERFGLFRNFWIPVEPTEVFLKRFTHGTSKPVHLTEKASGIFDADLYNLDDRESVVLNGYLQSFKYFDDAQLDVKCIMTFREDIYAAGKEILEKKMRDHLQMHPRFENPVLVGIQVRRRDFVEMEKKGNNDGRVPAPAAYFFRAVEEMRKKYGNNVIFVVISDDYEYCVKLFRGADYLVLQSNAPEVDMAILHLMEHMIMSAGTYGWWAAYSGQAADVIYYQDWPKPGSKMTRQYKREDFFPPRWKSLS